ncbi:peptide ABC transporter substrate-binding protein [Mesorhizobium sp. SARCC-RB16n]|uniref:ABC transporter substrate-binding protein n=1 Tax=Mesorhizobium sp. SARCC-RB16n TaxID=2116687 RepID=UPI00122EC62D|nr:ABC transporter substrate-binding protein [Mesorhizobium sp. SARCC-RB16n]KAA3441955.1 peptide ABC transporter substrate-binding protein [Mesorhizobium sp. SARCC-RB16n]
MKTSTNRSKSVAKKVMLSSIFAGMFFANTAMADTLRVIADADLKTIDPIVTTSGTTLVHAYLIYDKLFEFDKDGVARPQLADKVDISADTKSYTITLRKGLKFSDGGPITTDDVIQSLKRWASRDQTGQLLAARLKNITKVDDLTFRIELNEPFDVPAALAGVTGNPAFIMPKRVASLPPTDQLTDTTGSGPYQFDYSSWKPGQTRIYTKNPNYVPRNDPPSFFAGKKEATFDTIEMAYVPDANTAMAAMVTGQQDIWTSPPMDNALALKNNPDVVVAKGYFSQGLYVINHVVPPFDNVKAREALTYLIDQNEINRAAVGDQEFWHTCYAYLTCEGKFGDESAYAGHRGAADFDKAKELLKEAGYDGKPIVILDPTDWPEAHVRSLYMAQQLRKAGAQVDLQAMDWSTLTSRRTSKAPASEGGWNLFPNIMEGGPASSPLTHLMLASNCEKAWFGWPCDKKIEDLRAAFISAVDQNEKKKIASELQARASVYLPFVMTGEYTGAVVYRADIEGFNPETAETYFWNVRRKSK